MMKMKNCDVKLRVASVLLIAFAASCGGSEDVEDGSVLASVVTDDDVTIEFYQVEEMGAIIVSEVGPAELPSKVAAFAVEEATPLEMYLALAPSDEAPLELEIHHASLTDAPPRDLSTSFRSSSGSVSSADCSNSADADWFDDYSTWLNWTDTSYWSSTAAYNYLFTMTTNMLTHVCNFEDYSGTTAMQLKLKEVIEGVTLYTLSGIDTGERGVILLSGSSPYYYRSNAMGPLDGQTNTFRHGYMVP